MMKLWRIALGIAVLLLLLLGSFAAAELIPTPNFSQHEIPTTVVPQGTAVGWEYLDVAVLAVALGLASYWALVTRSRNKLFALSVFSLLWFGFWRQGCVCSIGAIQNVAHACGQSGYVIPVVVVAFFILPLIFTLFFGRTFCAAVCPLGAVQELVTVRSTPVPRWLDHTLSVLPFIYLGAAVLFAAAGTARLICRYDPFVAIFRLNGNANILIFGGCLLVIGLFVGRPYCRYLCPYGAILGLLSRISRWHVRIPPEECINCRLCEDVCPYGAIEKPLEGPSPQAAEQGKRRLLLAACAAPLMIGVLAAVGSFLAVPLSRFDPEVQLAEQLRREELGLTDATTEASDAFRNSGRSVDELYAATVARRSDFRGLGIALGAWVGLVIAIKLIALALPRRREEYDVNRNGCVSCGRCFWYCPGEQVRLGLIEDAEEVVKTK
jgi:polyferredoxin